MVKFKFTTINKYSRIVIVFECFDFCLPYSKMTQQMPPPQVDDVFTQEVWASNLEQEFKLIRNLIEVFPYIAMDTEFPGVVARFSADFSFRPIGNFKNSSDYHFQTLRCNVDLLKIIQLGLTFTNEYGQLPEGKRTWQFNFKFSLR